MHRSGISRHGIGSSPLPQTQTYSLPLPPLTVTGTHTHIILNVPFPPHMITDTIRINNQKNRYRIVNSPVFSVKSAKLTIHVY